MQEIKMNNNDVTVVGIQLSRSLRQKFKTLCAEHDVTMRDVIVKQMLSLMENSEELYRSPTPKEDRCNLSLNIPNDVLMRIDEYKTGHEYLKVRDLYITAIINY